MVQNKKLIVNFEPLSNEHKLVSAAKEYSEMWGNEGDTILSVFEKIGGSKFTEREIKAIIHEGMSRSGRSTRDPMMLRGSYPSDVKKATLIHELGHRYLFDLKNRQHGLDAHQILNLILYDIWMELYGEEFAEKQVRIESARKGVYDYAKTWKWALGLGEDGRKKMFRRICDR